MSEAMYMTVSPASIAPSTTNPRKTFTGIDELSESAKKHGIIVPLLVRNHPSPGIVVAYELVAGERRLRAAKLARLAEIPILLRHLSDKEVLEIQVIENVQREDVHPLEEADGYELLIEKHGYDVDMLADKIGKSKAYVYARLKLCSLAPGPRAAFLEDRLSASVALLIARIADVDLQEKACREVLGEVGDADIDLEYDVRDPISLERRELEIVDEDGKREEIVRIPMSVREAQVHLQRRYMLRLSLAKFNVADIELVPAAGACMSCDFRTGNQRELFADVSSADVCTKPSCFEAKTQASWAVRAAIAGVQGIKVVESKDSARVFTPAAHVRPTSPYVDPKATVPMDLLPAGTTKAPTWEKMLGKKLEAPKVLVQDASGAGHELLDKNAAVKVLREAGKIDKPEKPTASKSSSSSSSKDPYKDQVAKEEAKRRQWGRALQASLEEAWTKAAKLDPKDPAWWQWVCERLVEMIRAGAIAGADADAEDLLPAKSIAAYMQLVTAMVLEDASPMSASHDKQCWRDPGKEKSMLAGFELIGVDYDAHLERIVESDKAAAKAEKQIAEKKAAPKGDGERGNCCALESITGETCNLPKGHKGRHHGESKKGVSDWDKTSGTFSPKDDGSLCGVLDGKNGKPCIHKQGHDSHHSTGYRTFPNKPAKKKAGKK